MVYQWRDGCRISADAQTAGDMCKRLEAEGRLTAKALLDANRPKDAPLHGAFEWDDGVAAEAYREQQARHIIGNLVIVGETKRPVRGFFKVEQAEPVYRSIHAIVQEEDATAKLLASALKELQAFQNKYSAISQFAKLFQAIDEVKGQINMSA